MKVVKGGEYTVEQRIQEEASEEPKEQLRTGIKRKFCVKIATKMLFCSEYSEGELLSQ